MQQNDDVVSGWLSGVDSVGGFDNPAGPLFIDATTEKKMTSSMGGAIRLTHATTQSCASGCDCC
jgi:Family of unknown function (DUF6229)